MPVITIFFITAPKVQVDLVRKDFALASRTYDTGIIRQMGEINVHNPATQTLEKKVQTVDIPMKLTSNDVYY
jgi:hypothetical protein